MILSLLKERTRSLHEQAERAVDLEAGLRSLESYANLLSRFLGVYEPMEAVLRDSRAYESLGLEFASRRKTPRLWRDLAALDLQQSSIDELPRCADLPLVSGLSAAVGCAYVLEGATLGGRVVRREIERRLGAAAASASSFFDGYGDETADRWKEFRSAMTMFAERRPESTEEIVNGAAAAFRCIHAWMNRGAAG